MKNQVLLIFYIFIVISFITSCSKDDNPASKIPTEGLVAYYSFNGDFKDGSGNLHNGTINGTAAFVGDKNGNPNRAIDFTNNSSVSASIGRLGSMSISVWVKMPSPTTWYPTIIEYLPTNTSLYKGGFFFQVLGNIYTAQDQGKLNYSIYNDRQNIQTRDLVSTSSSLGYDAWNHLVFTYDSLTRNSKIYINSNLTTTETSINSLYDQNFTQITIGRQLINNPSKPTNFAGYIDELRIYNRALTSQEIIELGKE